ncbi:hypothetical protein [uncultured Desulfuromonas sp.]|uniref:hypothetical protein n=1 Tax=uncultured Desulfuromonas sp. TaxID=181013 RepID=UPI0026275602|nr:hypothetical protein [uncultured Desulfuromonas sp.]
MFGLFESIFGDESARDRYPEELVEKAIERAVDGTDPLLRGMWGYQRKLRPAVLKAMDHVVALVDNLAPPIGIDQLRYDSDPRLKSFFLSTEHMEKVLLGDPDLGAFRRGQGGRAEKISALLVMEKEEKGILGVDRVGEVLVHDVPQVTVSFGGHLLRDPAADLAQTRRLLKRRAFDHLLTLALAGITLVEDKREDLVRRQKLLQAKLDLLQRGNWGFDDCPEEDSPCVPELEERLDKIEADLVAIGADADVYEANLDLVVDVLGNPGEWIWAEKDRLIVDSMGIKRSEPTEGAVELELDQLSNAAGRTVVVALLSLSGAALRHNLY